MNWRFWTWWRKPVIPGDDWSPEAVTQAKAPKGLLSWLEDGIQPPPTFYCENCRSNEPHGMICDAIYGERKRCVMCFNVTPVLTPVLVVKYCPVDPRIPWMRRYAWPIEGYIGEDLTVWSFKDCDPFADEPQYTD